MRRAVESIAHLAHRVDRRRADDADAFLGQALGPEVGGRDVVGGEQQRRDVIDDDAVQLLGHVAIEGARAGFEVHDRDAELGRAQRPGQGGVGVALHQHRIGTPLGDHRLEPGQHPRRLLAVRGRADRQRVVGAAQPQLVEELRVHLVRVVLSGVDDGVGEPGVEQRQDRRQLDDLGPGPEEGEEAAHDGYAVTPATRREGLTP